MTLTFDNFVVSLEFDSVALAGSETTPLLITLGNYDFHAGIYRNAGDRVLGLKIVPVSEIRVSSGEFHLLPGAERTLGRHGAVYVRALPGTGTNPFLEIELNRKESL